MDYPMGGKGNRNTSWLRRDSSVDTPSLKKGAASVFSAVASLDGMDRSQTEKN
ncbi:hypothetical protein OAF34_03340 [Pirellulaceae bacterium]|jgi:hypothetical protein|nr:hypothetical protein [Pirellulaceae bacterium]